MTPRVFTRLNKAVKEAQRLAKEGPRVSSVVILHDGNFSSLPGYLDADTENYRMHFLVTPDGRIWEKKHEDLKSPGDQP